MRLPRLTVATGTAVILIDAVSKALAKRLLVSERIVHAGPLLELDLYHNHAGSGNMLTGRPVLVSVLSILAVIALAGAATRARGRGTSIGLGLLLGGGIGNLIDRVLGAPGPLRGGVIDWLRPFNSAGSMNLADLAINLGLAVLAITAAWRWWNERRAALELRDPG
jgi:signal peptidase II